jgi:mannose-6-phosphate isomerase-like protein (cupin superfamily)
MKHSLYTYAMVLAAAGVFPNWLCAQEVRSMDQYAAPEPYENIHVQKLDEDERVSTFLIWIKDEVREHHHATHSEVVYIVEGHGSLWLGGVLHPIKAGDYVYIPAGTPHRVRVESDIAMKAISIQTPMFDGSDRVFTSQY